MHAFITRKPKLENQNSPDVLVIKPENSIGIEEVRQIQSFLSRKPIQSDHNTVYIHNAHLLTLPAQHALLKTLEEPPGNSLIYLITSSPYSLLPTVLSRVQITNLPNPPDHPDLSKSQALFSKLKKVGVGERLKILEEQEFTRESSLKFLDDLEYLIHQDLSLSKIYPVVVETKKYLKANCNLKLCLSHLALGLQNC